MSQTNSGEADAIVMANVAGVRAIATTTIHEAPTSATTLSNVPAGRHTGVITPGARNPDRTARDQRTLSDRHAVE